MYSQNELAKRFTQGAKSGKASNMFIDTRNGLSIIYSYGTHFPVAIKKGCCYIFNTDKYSQTTSCHQSGVRAAINMNGGEVVKEVDTETINKYIRHGVTSEPELMATMLKNS